MSFPKALCACVGERCRLTDDDCRHGSANGYGNLKCRCEPCRAAHARYVYDCKEIRKQRPTPDHVHGTPNGYGNWGCRCRDCTDAYTDDSVDRYHRRARRQTDIAAGTAAPPQWRFEDRPHKHRGVV